MHLVRLRLTELQEQPEEVKKLQVHRQFDNWIYYKCDSQEFAQALVTSLVSRGYEAKESELISVIGDSTPIERTIFLRLERSELMPECLKPFYSGPKISRLSVYEFRFQTAEEAQKMLATLLEQRLDAWKRNYVEY